jgi:hypothetical protein
LQRWLTYIELFNVRFEFTRGLSMGIADYLSRACTPDDSLPDDGEADKDKFSTDLQGNVVVDALTARYQFCELYGMGDSCDLAPPIVVEAAGPLPSVDAPADEYTMFSACGGIGSGQIAADHAALKVRSIGMSEIDEERIAIYQKANPNVPVYGALGAVTAALECGDLVLDPTILELTTPCQAHSQCRVLAGWSHTAHPHARLWDEQVKLIRLAMAPVVIIENVPPWRNADGYSTDAQFERLKTKVEALGYNYVHTTLRCSLHGDRTQRVRYFAIATLKPRSPHLCSPLATKLSSNHGGISSTAPEWPNANTAAATTTANPNTPG